MPAGWPPPPESWDDLVSELFGDPQVDLSIDGDPRPVTWLQDLVRPSAAASIPATLLDQGSAEQLSANRLTHDQKITRAEVPSARPPVMEVLDTG